MAPSTAILLFSRTALAEAGSKCYGKRDDSLRASRLLVGRTLDTLSRSGLPVFHFDQRQQRGDRFGDRLANSMAEVFSRGYDRLIVVGNDCPALRVHHLNHAVKALERGKAVLGPDHRGGVWLMGLRRSQFNEAGIKNIAWQSHGVLKELMAVLSEVIHLPRLADINGRRDLHRFWHVLRSFLSELFGLLGRPRLVPVTEVVFGSTGHNTTQGGRAPPVGS